MEEPFSLPLGQIALLTDYQIHTLYFGERDKHGQKQQLDPLQSRTIFIPEIERQNFINVGKQFGRDPVELEKEFNELYKDYI